MNERGSFFVAALFVDASETQHQRANSDAIASIQLVCDTNCLGKEYLGTVEITFVQSFFGRGCCVQQFLTFEHAFHYLEWRRARDYEKRSQMAKFNIVSVNL